MKNKLKLTFEQLNYFDYYAAGKQKVAEEINKAMNEK